MEQERFGFYTQWIVAHRRASRALVYLGGLLSLSDRCMVSACLVPQQGCCTCSLGTNFSVHSGPKALEFSLVTPKQ